MKILVNGNGFDLAHGLPTSYTDFLEFCKRVKIIFSNTNLTKKQYEQECIQEWRIDSYVKKRLKEAFESRECRRKLQEGEHLDDVTTQDAAINELYTYIEHNTWLEYFWNCPSYVGENWIDFEAEISKVIQSLDSGRLQIEKNLQRFMKSNMMNCIRNMKCLYLDILWILQIKIF